MTDWKFVEGQKSHTQDGSRLVEFMKSIGKGLRPIKAIDVGCGDGIIAFDMLTHNKASSVVAFDILKPAADAAQNNLKKYIESRQAEVFRKSARTVFKNKKLWGTFDLMAINPPFFVSGSGTGNKNPKDQMARHDKSLNLKLWAGGARKLLKTSGELYCIFPTERLAELLSALRINQIEPKEIWWLKRDKRRRRVFVRAVRGAKTNLKVNF